MKVWHLTRPPGGPTLCGATPWTVTNSEPFTNLRWDADFLAEGSTWTRCGRCLEAAVEVVGWRALWNGHPAEALPPFGATARWAS